MLRMTRQRFATPHWVLAVCTVFAAFFILHGGGFVAAAQAAAVRPYSGEELYRGLVLAHGPVADLIPEIRDHYRVTNFVKDADDLKMIETAQDRIIDAIRDNHPTFFVDFADMVQSGDHLKIHQALSWASEVTMDSVSSLEEVQQLRQQTKADATQREALIEEMKNAEGAEQLSQEDLDYGAELLLADTLDAIESPSPKVAFLSIVAVIVAVAAIVAAITVVAAQSYALALNIAAAINVAAAVVAWVEVYTPEKSNIADSALFEEQMIDSVATQLAL